MTQSPDNSYRSRGTRPLLRKTPWWRVVAFTAVNTVVFAVLCAFWHYQTSGRWIQLSPGSYLRAVQTPLGHAFLGPLGVLEYPWMIAVTALTLGSICVVPVLVSVLLPVRYAVAFVIVLAVAAHTPVLAGVVLVGCLLAARTPLRSDMPFAATLLGMLPIAVYLLAMAYLGVNTVTVTALQRWVLYAPLVGSGIVAVVIAVIVLTLTRLIRLRPGAVWPGLILAAAGAVVLFHARVGPDELHYQLIARPLPNGTSLFAAEDFDPWRANHAAGLADAALLSRAKDHLEQRRALLIAQTDAFVRRYPTSRRSAEVLWIQASALSLQLDEHAFYGHTGSGRRRLKYVAQPPLNASAEIYERLRDQHPTSPQAALAYLRLAQLAMKDADVLEASERLVIARQRLAAVTTAMGHRLPRDPTSRIFLPRSIMPEPVCFAEGLFQADRLAWLIDSHNVIRPAESAVATPTVNPEAAEILSAVAQLDPNRLDYADVSARLARKYGASPLADELKLIAARAAVWQRPVTPRTQPANMNEPARRAVETLKALAARTDQTSTFGQANYLLGHLAMQATPGLQTPQEYFRKVVKDPPNPWRGRAAGILALLGDADTRPPPQP